MITIKELTISDGRPFYDLLQSMSKEENAGNGWKSLFSDIIR